MKAFDDFAWETITDMTEEWLELLEYDMVIYRDVGIFLSAQYSSLQWTNFGYCNASTFNAVFRMRFANEYSAIIRFPLLAATIASDLSLGKETRESLIFGSFHHYGLYRRESMSDFLNTRGRGPDQLSVLNPDLDMGKPGNLYRQLRNIILSLSTLSFSQIGCLDSGSERRCVGSVTPASVVFYERDCVTGDPPPIQTTNHHIQQGIIIF
ncbi:hypothetical protein N7454_001529 [Penicillium verhagenii]|nr:hypothetical protein N7454_001529 [Penicillium verhagenii]